MKLLLETRSGHLPKNSRSLPDYEYKSHYVCMSKVSNKPTFTRVQNDKCILGVSPSLVSRWREG